jgi:HSP20 family protein
MLHLINPSAFAPSFAARSHQRPEQRLAAASVRETTDSFVLQFDLPGVNPNDVDLSVSAGRLSLKAERVLPKVEGERLLRSELYQGQIHREFTLPESADLNQVDAQHSHGVLTVTIKKRAELAPRKISIAA